MKMKSFLLRRSMLRLEQLERRDAPATLVSPTKLTYQDVDGDNVTVTLSKPIPAAVNVNNVFKFNAGIVDGKNAIMQQLQSINLTGIAAMAGTSINVTATHGMNTPSDGQVNVGYINAAGLDLGPVTVAGDLGRIDAGDGDPAAPALRSLSVRSIGRLGTDTGGGSLHSDISGDLSSLTVKGDMIDAGFTVHGKIGSVFIGGSLIGHSKPTFFWFAVSGDMGSLRIAHDVIGGPALDSGEIAVGGKLAGISIGGSLIGGTRSGAGDIDVSGDIGPINIAHNLVGGGGNNAGDIHSDGKIASITIGGSVIGGAGNSSGNVGSKGDIGPLRIGHDLLGGAGIASGEFDSGGKLATVTIGGSIIGSSSQCGFIGSIGDMGAVSIGRDLQGGGSTNSGSITSGGKLASLRIGGSIVGGTALQTGFVLSAGDMGAVRIAGDLRGGLGSRSGRIESDGNLASVSIGGSMIGGEGPSSGIITTPRLRSTTGPITIGHDLLGGIGTPSGEVSSGGSLASITIGGSLIGGLANGSGEITSGGDIGPIRIGHDLMGVSIAGTTPSPGRSADIRSDGRIASVSIGGSIISGVDTSTAGSLTYNATIRAADDIGSLTVTGSIIGNSNPNGDTPVIISARGRHTIPAGATSDLAIGRIFVGGRVEYAQFLAGYEPNLLAPKNPDAQIGPVNVGKDWIASDLVAGVDDHDNNGFGNSDDVKISGPGTSPDSVDIVSKIAGITIGGIAIGTPDSVSTTDHYGFVAQQIGSLRVNGFNIPLYAGAANDLFPGVAVGATNDLNLLEVPL